MREGVDGLVKVRSLARAFPSAFYAFTSSTHTLGAAECPGKASNATAGGRESRASEYYGGSSPSGFWTRGVVFLSKLPMCTILACVFILVGTPIFFNNFFRPCMDCFDFEASIDSPPLLSARSISRVQACLAAARIRGLPSLLKFKMPPGVRILSASISCQSHFE